MSQNNIDITRHSFAHILALAVKKMWPDVKFATGLNINNGFFYDFDFGEKKISISDLGTIERKMKELIKQDLRFQKNSLNINKAFEKEKERNAIYKQEIIKELKQKGEKKVNYYKIDDFEDLCKGPHITSTNNLNKHAFKINKTAGAYWHGDEKNKMLTRIYGLAFETKEELDNYLENIEESLKRDHRKIGKELDLFHIDDKVGLGLPLWHPKGAMLWKIIEDFWHKEHLASGYDLVRTPHIGNRSLWETSGHLDFYSNSMFPPIEISQSLKEKQDKKKINSSEEYLLKPMNCPFHIQIYKENPKSYRDFPIRWAECGTVYRFEKRGELSGLTRVRGFTQDDAHIICRKDQIENELKKIIDFILFIFKSFGFNLNTVNVYLSLRDVKNKDKYSGSEEGWIFTEKILKKIADEKKLNYVEEKGEAAFYGPKLDFKIKDVLGREWQCSTLQFDFNLPKRFNMTFINNEGKEETPYMIHRALFGSFERFIALLIEHYAGAFPIWLSPVQIKLIPVNETYNDYCCQLAQEFKNNNLRIEIDDLSETVGNKIRKSIKEKVPYILVIGEKEKKSNNLSVRSRKDSKIEILDKGSFIKKILKAIENKN